MAHEHDPSRASAMEPAIDLRRLLRRLCEKFWVILLCALLGLLAGMFWAWRSGPWYEVVVVAVPSENEIGGASSLMDSAGLAGLIGLAPPGRVTLQDEAIATLTSRNFLYSFVEDFDLLPVLFGDGRKWWQPSFWPIKDPTVSDAYELILDEILSVSEKRKTGMIEITVQWSDPETTADWGRTLVNRLNGEMQARTKKRAIREMDFLKKELAETDSVQVRQAIFQLVETQMKTLMLANVSDDFALRVVDSPIAPDVDKPVNLSFLAKSILGAFLGLLLGLGYSVVSGLRDLLVR